MHIAKVGPCMIGENNASRFKIGALYELLKLPKEDLNHLIRKIQNRFKNFESLIHVPFLYPQQTHTERHIYELMTS